MAVNRKYRDARSLAREAAVFMAARLSRVGIRTVVVSREEARRVRRGGAPGTEFSVADIQRLNYQWNGEQVSLKAFAQAFMPLIKNKDRTLEDVERIAEAFIADVKSSPEKYVPQLKAENMSHARYFILRDGSVWTPEHPMAHSPEYETQQALWKIYSHVLGTERMEDFISLLDPARLRTDAENERFVSMEREVSRSDLMQQTLESNADKVNADRVRAVRNLVQYFDGNPDYTASEKALILKGAMTWGVSEKKGGDGSSEVRLVRLTDANDISVPVIGGEAASVVEGIRKGMNFRDALQDARERILENGDRSVPKNFTGWKVYPKSDLEEDAVILNQDAAGTGWCTGSGLSTARNHLSGGDFHIYFEAGEPLIAIRTENGRMAEPPRGAHEGQFCTDREEQIAFDYIREGHGITAGQDYVSDIEDIRRVMSPDATWMDAFMMPERRRYENGEFGGDTSAWGEAVEERIRRLLSDSRDERIRAGYYVDEEVSADAIDWNKLKAFRGSLDIFLHENATVRADSLESVVGDIILHANATLQADSLKKIGGRLFVNENAALRADSLESIGVSVILHEKATLQAASLKNIGKNVELHEYATFRADSLESIGEDIRVDENATLQVNSLKNIGEDVEVNENAILRAASLKNIGGSLEVYEDATLQADSLESIGGLVVLYENATLQAQSLNNIGGYLDVSENVTLWTESLKNIGMDLHVYENVTLQADSLESIGGLVVLYENATLQVNSLKNIGGSLEVYEDATLQADSLKSIGGGLYVYEDATLQVNSLKNIGEDVEVNENAILRAASLKNIGGSLEVYENATVRADSLKSIGGHIRVYENATVWADSLESVVGDIILLANATLQVNSLKSIGERVILQRNAILRADSLENIGGLYVYENVTLQADSLGNIGKNVVLFGNATLRADSLESIGGDIRVSENATLQVNSLKNIGGDLEVDKNAPVEAASLRNIGGNLYVYENATLQVNSLEGVANGIHVHKNAFLEALNLKSVNKKADIHFHDTAILRIPNLKEDFSFSNGVIYGYQIGDTIFLTPDGINPETPIHEYAHVWAKAMQRLRPGQWETVKEALKELPVWDRVSADPEYRNLVHDEDRLAGEVLAAVTGGFGAKLLEETAGEFVSGRRGESWSVGDVVEAFRETVSSFAVKEVFGCGERLSACGATLLVLKDLSEGRNPAQSLKGGLREDNPEKGPSVQNELINHAGRKRPQYNIKL